MRVGFQETSQSKILESQICVQNGGSISTAQRTAERAAKMCPIKRFQLALATFNLCNAKMVKVLVTYLIWHAFGCKVWQKVHLGSQVPACFNYSDPNNKLALLSLLVPTRPNGSEKHNQGIKESLDASWAWSTIELEAKMRERSKIFASCSCSQDGLFVFPTRRENQR